MSGLDLNVSALEPTDVCCGTERLPVPVCGPWEQLTPFQYTPELVAGPGAGQDPSEVTIQGCDCQHTKCIPEFCSCLPCGTNYSSRCIVSRLGPILECNIMCSCGESCPNRESQHGLQFHLQLCKRPGKGWGLCTQEDIPSGRFVCEYAGEVLSREQAHHRMKSQKPGSNNYIIAVREHLHDGQIMETFVDPTQKGNLGRFLNHSCEPNLFMMPIRSHSMVPRLVLFAARNIQAGEELCYDYSGRFFNQIPDSKNQNVDQEESCSHTICHCGSGACTGYLPYESSLF